MYRLLLCSTSLVVLASCASLPHATLLDAQRARERWPEASLESLEAGRQAYVARCSGCHALHLPEERPPEVWPKMVAQMERDQGVRVRPEERELILRYLMTMSTRAADGSGRGSH